MSNTEYAQKTPVQSMPYDELIIQALRDQGFSPIRIILIGRNIINETMCVKFIDHREQVPCVEEARFTETPEEFFNFINRTVTVEEIAVTEDLHGQFELDGKTWQVANIGLEKELRILEIIDGEMVLGGQKLSDEMYDRLKGVTGLAVR